ncbi:MAG: hypothetical protein K0B02_01730 [DPANN group archaeon]|nr:hypothetical protein [DPANN group archaeon]
MHRLNIYPKELNKKSKIIITSLIIFCILLIIVSLYTSGNIKTLFCENEKVLIINSNGGTFGTLLGEDKNHVFPNGAVGGYNIISQTGENTWVISSTVDGFARKETRCIN